MEILLLGALSWNPERVLTLAEHGHHLFGLWSRTMAWEQGPYPFATGVITDVTLEHALDLLHSGRIDLVYSLFQIYDAKLWGRQATPGTDDVWSQLRQLLEVRRRGGFTVPVMRHWGCDVHHLDMEVVRALDGQIFCNPHKLRYWTASRAQGGCGLALGCEQQTIAFMDSDLPSRAFMNDRFSPKRSATDGQIHTVCVGRPMGIDFVSAARQGIHVHVYGNDFDDLTTMIARGLSLRGLARWRGLIDTFLHLHPPLQPAGGSSLQEIRHIKNRWVEEFSQYDAGWSYVEGPVAWPRLEDQAAIPNRHGLYLLAGLPVITRRLPGFDRYDSLARHDVVIDFSPQDYAALAARLRRRDRLAEMQGNARRSRERFSFDATVQPLTGYFERICDIYPRRRRASQTVVLGTSPSRVHLPARPLSLRNLLQRRAPAGAALSGLKNGLELTWSRARWQWARVLGRCYVSRLLPFVPPGAVRHHHRTGLPKP